jgi:ribose 5-phosphate isomerase A
VATDAAMLKRRAAEAAIELVESGMAVGLGTGSTAEQFVNILASAIRGGALEEIECVATSSSIEEYASQRGIVCRSLAELAPLDLSVDGADEVDPELRLVKGRGGALLREKIVAQASRLYVIIVDESKLVDRLGAGLLPVEVSPFAAERLLLLFGEMGIDPVPRTSGGSWFRTDEGNRIIDVTVPADRTVEDLVNDLQQWSGVVETGYFPREAHRILVANPDGLRTLDRPGSSD